MGKKSKFNRFSEIIWKVLDHFTEKSFHRKCLTERSFDRKTIWPNRRSTKRRLTESSFYRKVIWLIFFFRKWSFDRIYFRQKMSFDQKKIAHKVVWPKIHLTECFFDRKFIWPKAFFEKWSFDRMFFFLKKFRFQKIVIWPTVHIPLDKYMCPTSSSPPGAVKEKKLFIYCH
jgi:hypothetical protein